jgi:hypothetical protein
MQATGGLYYSRFSLEKGSKKVEILMDARIPIGT